MKRLICAAVLIGLLIGCSFQPPPDEGGLRLCPKEEEEETDGGVGGTGLRICPEEATE